MNLNSFKVNPYTLLFIRLAVFLFFLSLSRMFLYVFNLDYFNELSFFEILIIFLIGLRFDLSTLILLNTPLILISLWPFNFNHKERVVKIVLYITLLFIGLAIIFNLIDVIYFRFTLKRSTFDIFNFIQANEGIYNIFKALLFDYWYIILIATSLISLMIFGLLKIKDNDNLDNPKPPQIIIRSLLLLVAIGIGIIGVRGGTQLKPINMVDASKMVNSKYVPLVLNTAFTIIKTQGKQPLKLKNWYTSDQAISQYNPVHKYNLKDTAPKKKNVIVIILESFSTSKIGYFNQTQNSLTPFLDSLLKKSLTFKGIANGKKSIEGIPAILSAIPSYMTQPFLTSPFAANQISSLASILNRNGYTSAFFHGGKNGTMNFDSYAAKADFEYYFGMDEYKNMDDYDHCWGIWDHAFFPFFKTRIDTLGEPFIAAFFSLSSHHPYSIPAQFQDRFQDSEPINNSISYADFSLSKFFESIIDESWYNNTLFVITADHTAEIPNTRDSANTLLFEIPIAFFAPNDTSLINKEHRKIAQQTDILPSIIHYLNFPDPVVSFGNSVFDLNAPDFALYYLNEIYHGINSKSVFEFNGNEFNYTPFIKIETKEEEIMRTTQENQVKALIQNYSNFMIHNKLTVDNP